MASDEEVTHEALISVLKTVNSLSNDQRKRVLRAATAFFGEDVPAIADEAAKRFEDLALPRKPEPMLPKHPRFSGDAKETQYLPAVRIPLNAYPSRPPPETRPVCCEFHDQSTLECVACGHRHHGMC